MDSIQISKTVSEIYNQLELQIQKHLSPETRCLACGRCCNFDSFDHQLFVTTPEMIYLTTMLGNENIRAMPGSICPYNTNNKCTIYLHRFAGCRIFHCKTTLKLQSKLSERAIKKLKSLCNRLDIPYHYDSLATMLNTFNPNTCQPAEGYYPADHEA